MVQNQRRSHSGAVFVGSTLVKSFGGGRIVKITRVARGHYSSISLPSTLEPNGFMERRERFSAFKLTIFKREFLIFSGFSVQDFIHTFPLSGALGLFDSVILRAYLRDCLNRLAFLSLNNFQICALYSMTMITFFMAVLTACCYCTHFFISLYSDWHIPKEAPWGHIHTCLHHRDIPALDTITINSTW